MTFACVPPTCSTSGAVITVDLPGHVVNNRGEVGGSVETHGFETLVISLHHSLDTTAVRILWITVLWKNRHKEPLTGTIKDSYNAKVKLLNHLSNNLTATLQLLTLGYEDSPDVKNQKSLDFFR